MASGVAHKSEEFAGKNSPAAQPTPGRLNGSPVLRTKTARRQNYRRNGGRSRRTVLAPTSPSNMRTSPPRTAHRHSLGPASRWQDYLPLVVVIAVALLAATALHVGESVPDRGHGWMLDAMGLFLAIFSMFKFFDLSGFADGFQMYDLLAKRARAYALFYPFVELGLALGYLARWRLPAVYGITVMVMLFGALGVIGALRRK